MCNATVTKTAGGWMVTINGQFYGEYKTPEKAHEIANSFRSELFN